MRDENQLHAAIVEIIVKDNAEVKYSMYKRPFLRFCLTFWQKQGIVYLYDD